MSLKKQFILLIFVLASTYSYALGFVIKDTNVCVSSPFLFKDTTTPPAGLTIINRNWNFDGINSVNSTVDSVYYTYTTSGVQYTVTLTVTYSDNSSVSWSYPSPIYIRNKPRIDLFTISDTITCPNVPITFNCKSSQVNLTDGVLTSWNLDFGNINSQTLFSGNETVIFGYAAAGQYTAQYTVSDQYGCTASASRPIGIYSHPIVKFEAITPRCKDSIVLYENRTRNRDTTWNWSWTFFDSAYVKGSLNQDSMTNSNIRNYNSADAYHTHVFPTTLPNHLQRVILYGINKYRCFGYDTQYFKVDTTPILVIEPSIDTTICFGNSIKYTIRGSDTVFYSTFLWGEKIKNDSVVLFTPKNTITYKVYGKTPQCPPAGKDIKIRVVQPIATNITLNPANILKGNQAIMELNTSAVFDSIYWNPNNTLSRPYSDSTGASPQSTTRYYARVYYSLDRYVCFKDDSAILYVDSTCNVDSLKIPTAFTPNGDNLNDEFYIKSFSLKNILSFNVYNRWGDRVYKIENVAPNDPQFGWNGKLNNTGEDLPIGTYVYNISAICANNQLLNFQGEITIIR